MVNSSGLCKSNISDVMALTSSSLPCKPISTTIPDKYVSSPFISFPRYSANFSSNCRLSTRVHKFSPVSCHNVFLDPYHTTQYEFNDGPSDVELRLLLGNMKVQSSKDIHVDANARSLVVGIKQPGSIVTLMETKQLYDRINPGETIWYLDDDQLVINMRKHDQELKWPNIVESWESLSTGVSQLLKGTSLYLVGDSSEINQKVAEELAVGLRYTPLDTKGLLETYAEQNIESFMSCISEELSNLTNGPGNPIRRRRVQSTYKSKEVSSQNQLAMGGVTSRLISTLIAAFKSSGDHRRIRRGRRSRGSNSRVSHHVRTVIATIGGNHGAAGRADKWQHLYAGFTVWLSQSEAIDEDSAKEEAKKQVCDGSDSYSKADVVVKFDGWDSCHAKAVAQACLSALKQLLLSDKKLPGKKSLYIRLGCRGDWPNIKPPGWDPSTVADTSSNAL